MSTINLLPLHHQLRRRHARIVRRWMGVSALYAAVLVVTALVVHGVYAIGDAALPAEIEQLQSQAAQIEKVHQATLAQLTKVNADIELRDIVDTPPDFAVLLSALSKSCADDAILTSLKWEMVPSTLAAASVGPNATAGKAAIDPMSGPMHVKLEMSGLAQTQPGVGIVVQRLQNTGLFDEVRLTKTSREGFLAADALAFQLTCDIESGTGPRSEP